MRHLALIIATLALTLSPSTGSAQTAPTVDARVEVAFDVDPRNPAGAVEYFVEQKSATGTWAEVAKGSASPILYTLPAVRIGDLITVRVRGRLVADLTSITDPTNETSARVPARKPSNARSKASEPVAVTLKPGQTLLIAAAAQ